MATPFSYGNPEDEETEEDRVLREYLALQSDAAAEAPAQDLSVEALPDPAPEMPVEPSRDDVFAQYAQTQPPHSMRSSYQAPPEVKPRDNKWLWIAGALDLALNKGQGLPQYVGALAQQDGSQYENWKRKNDAMNDASMRDARGMAYGNQAAARELQRQRLSQGADRLEMQKGAQERLGDKFNIENDPNDASAERTRQALITAGVPVESVNGLSVAEMKALSPATKHFIENSMKDTIAETKATSASAISDATQANKLELVREGAQIRNEADAVSPQTALDERKFYAAEADKYNKYTEFYRTGASFLRDAEGVLERNKGGDLPGIGMADSRAPDMLLSDDGLTLRQAQSWMNNAIQRADSGAAAPIAEELKFAIRSGSKPGATEREVQVGLKAAATYLRTQLKGAATGYPEAARGVLRESGLEDWVYPAQPTSKRSSQRPRSAPANSGQQEMSEEEFRMLQDLGGDF